MPTIFKTSNNSIEKPEIPYSRENPSPRYQSMVQMYQTMHDGGDAANGLAANETFDGRSLAHHTDQITQLIQSTQSRTLLDYGCGKASAYDNQTIKLQNGQKIIGLRNLWQGVNIRLYDPCYQRYQTFPNEKYDAVISTDVLEHITKEDVPWVIDEILGLANKFVYLNIACYPARKNLPSGENAHITQESPGWWLDLVHNIKLSKYPDLKVMLAINDQQLKRIMVQF